MKAVRKAPLWLALGLSFLFMTGAANASVVIGGTRVIFPGKEREVTVRLSNERDGPSLVEAWIDPGEEIDAQAPLAPASAPNSAQVPFVLTPPLFRLDARKGQTLRIFRAAGALPQDRESLFWLNVLDVPPSPKQPGNYLKLAVRTRIKLFYRPQGLSGTAGEAADQLQWTMSASAANSPGRLHIKNPTPFHVTITSVDLSADTEVVGKMIPPFGELELSLADARRKQTAQSAPPQASAAGAAAASSPSAKPATALPVVIPSIKAGDPLKFTIVNDYGGTEAKSARIATPSP
jgi:chaperone protein EcpD